MPGNPNAPLRHPLFILEFREFSRNSPNFAIFSPHFAPVQLIARGQMRAEEKKSDHYYMITEGAGGSQNQEIHQLLLKKLDGNFFFPPPNPLSTL